MKNKIIWIVFILTIFLFPNFSFCQNSFEIVQDTVQSHYFLWFHGHWDSKMKNTFDIKPAFGSGPGGTATVEQNGNARVQSPSMDDWDKFFDQGLDDIDKWEKELASHDYQEWEHHFNVTLMPYLELKKKEWNAYKIKPEEKKVDLEQLRKQKLQFLDNSIENSCKRFKPRFDQIMNYYKKHRRDNYKDLIVPPPPETDYTCTQCDTNIEKRNEKVVDDYEKKFVQPESDMIRDLLPRMRDMELVGIGEPTSVSNYHSRGDVNSLFGIVTKEFYNKNGACYYLNDKRPELWEIVRFLARHVLDRAEKLVKVYQKNFKTQLALTKVYLMVARSNELLGNSADENEFFGELNGMLENEFYYYKHRLFGEHDWSQLSNFHLFFEIMRSYALLGGDDKEFLNEWTKLAKLMNNFQLSIDMNVSAAGKAFVHLKGKAKVAPQFFPDSNKCYTWVVVKDKPGGDGFPIKDGAGMIHCDLLQNTMPGMTYIGTKNYYTELKQLKMDYCHPGQDTIMFTGFIPDPAGNGWWVNAYGQKFELELDKLDTFFQDKSKDISEAGNLKQMMPGIKSKGMKIKAQLEAMESKMKNGNGMPDIHKLQELANKSMGLLNSQKIAGMFYIDFSLLTNNRTKTLVNKTYYIKDVDPMLARTAHGSCTIKIEYLGK